MKLFIHFLLISSLSLIIYVTAGLPSKEDIERFADGKNLPDTKLRLIKEGELSRDDSTAVWKGIYNDSIRVAIKVYASRELFKNEIKILTSLDSLSDPEIEKQRIPRVYFRGQILGDYFVIAMSSYDVTLENHLSHPQGVISDAQILLIYKQIVQALKYIYYKNVKHYQVTTKNILIRGGQDVFLGNFESSEFKSLGTAMGEYEMFLECVWVMVGVPPNELSKPNYLKLTYFKDPIVQTAFRDILEEFEIIQRKYLIIPQYNDYIEKAEAALAAISVRSGPVHFDWLAESGSTGASSSH